MRRPIEPRKPVKPEETLYDRVYSQKYIDSDSEITIKDFKEVSEELNIPIESVILSVRFELDYGYGDDASSYVENNTKFCTDAPRPNPNYDKLLKKYQKDLKVYETKMKEYEVNLELYNRWLKSKEYQDKQKEIKKLKNRLQELEDES